MGLPANQLSDSTSVNMGKLRLPLYIYSDSLDVGYSYHWLRTPQSVYRVAFDNYTGVSVQHNAFVGDFIFNTQVIAGTVKDDVEAGGSNLSQAELNNLIGFNASAIYNNLTMRIAYYQTNDTNIHLQEIDTLLTSLEQIGAGSVASELEASEDKGAFAGVGFMYDNFNWFVGAEYTQLEVENSYIPKQRSSYITAGKRFENWSLHGTLGQTDDKIVDAEQRFTVPAPQLQAIVNQVLGGVVNEATYSSVGVNFNVAPGAVFKFDVTHSDDKRTDESDVLVSAAVQFVF